MSQIEIVTDEIAERLDELADLGEIWNKHRKAGRMPLAVRSAMIQIAGEVELMRSVDANNLLGQRRETKIG